MVAQLLQAAHWMLWNAPIVVVPMIAGAFFYLGRLSRTCPECPRCARLDHWQKTLDLEIKREKGLLKK